MKRLIYIFLQFILCCVFLILNISLFAENKSEPNNDKNDNKANELSFSALMYLHYEYNMTHQVNKDADKENPYLNKDENKFEINRVYLTVKNKFNEYLAARITTDIVNEPYSTGFSDKTVVNTTNEQIGNIKNGEATGNSRLLYLVYAYGDIIPIQKYLTIRIGMQETPWINYECRINDIGFIERGIIDIAQFWNSKADLGLSLRGEMPFKLGDYHLMVSNGSGYKKWETDRLKTGHGRITFTPFKIIGFDEKYKDIGLGFGFMHHYIDNSLKEFIQTYSSNLFCKNLFDILTLQLNFGLQKNKYESKDTEYSHIYGLFIKFNLYTAIDLPIDIWSRLDIYKPTDEIRANAINITDRERYYALGGINYNFTKDYIISLNWKSIISRTSYDIDEHYLGLDVNLYFEN